MKKLTKDQKHYRKKKKDGQKDFRRTTREDGSRGVRVTRRTINVSISAKAFNRLIELSEICELTRWEMLSRIILIRLPSYASETGSRNPTQRYRWDESLLIPTDKKISYKATEGERQVTYQITSTAYKKLECHKNAIGQSKARIVQSLILNYEPMTEAEKEKRKQYLTEQKRQSRMLSQPSSTEELLRKEKPSKLFMRDGLILHKKGIPPEKWDEDELDEFERLAGGSYK
tara:strand:+ start:65 stop:754 length:690 start_codon:yes stop_codon:yes gene_type:complete